MIKIHKLKGSHVYIILLVILSIFMVRNGIGLHKVQYPGDATGSFFPKELVIKESFLKGAMPLWDPFIMSGTPLLAKVQWTVLSTYTLIQILTPSPYLAMTINGFIHLIILGIGLYLLSRTVGIEPRYAFISSLVCMLSGYIAHLPFFEFFTLMGIAFFPYVIMFTIKGLKSERWVKYAILSGIFVSMEFLSGAFEIFVFSWWPVLFILAFNLLGKSFSKKLSKSISFGIIFFIVVVGLISIKFLPATEFTNMSNRQYPFNFEKSIGSHVNLKNAFFMIVDDRKLPNFIDHAVKGTSSLSIGIVPSLLVLISLFNFRKKKYLLFLGMAILAIVMITKSPWNYLLWKFFPYFNKQKHVLKAQFVFLIVASVLAAYGVRYLISKIKDKNFAKITYFVILILIVLTSWGFTYDIKMKDARPELDSVEIMKYMAKDEGIFRFKEWETNGIDWGTNYYFVYHGLQNVYGFDNMWVIDYLPVFLSVANRDPAKFFGIMNMKYMTSMNEINITGFELVKKFDNKLANCTYVNGQIEDFNKMEQCPGYEILKKAWGPYLYQNMEFLPRVYMVENSILVVGEKNEKMQTVYGLMLNPKFKPENSAIFVGKDSINDYNLDELNKYKVIVLSKGSIDANSVGILQSYVSNGGILLPDIIKGKNSITSQEIESIFDLFNGSLKAIDDKDYIEHNFNKYEVNLNGKYQERFLILSEKFSMFPGWIAKADGKTLPIEKVNGVISAVYIDKPYKSVVFEYKPRTYIIGRNITMITLVIVLVYFGYSFFRRS